MAQWIGGRSLLDPSLGTGNLLIALVEEALSSGHNLKTLPFERLFGIEIDPALHSQALRTFRSRWGVEMGTTFVLGDLFETQGIVADLVFGNPPWLNFTDLSPELKPLYKRRFLDSGLVANGRKLLLGGSRIDVAALVTQHVIEHLLHPGGKAFLFLPLSLLLNDGAHEEFRRYHCGATPFAPLRVLDFQREPVFGGVATRYGLVEWERDRRANFPIPYERFDGKAWVVLQARPLFQPSDPLAVLNGSESDASIAPSKIVVSKRSSPRQGVNTGGANELFFFDQCLPVDDGNCEVGNGVLLPSSLLHPLLTARDFREPGREPSRWVLLPYSRQGKPLSATEIEARPSLRNYLDRHRQRLVSRKGALLQSSIARGLWWTLQGVGPYSFAPFKIVWEAYGKHSFRPLLWEGRWQVNQALQAGIPFWSLDEAERVLTALNDPAIEAGLLSMQGGGTKNWAQPGKIRRWLEFTT